MNVQSKPSKLTCSGERDEKTETTSTTSGAVPDGHVHGVSRRQIVRAGLSAAPVVAALKSNTVLAGAVGGGQGNGVTTSAFASLQANQGRVSNARYKTDCIVRTPAEWKLKQSEFKKRSFRSAALLPTPKEGSGAAFRWGCVGLRGP